MKKFFTYPVFLVLFLSFIGVMGFGAIVKYHYDGGKKYQFLQKPVIFLAEFPMNTFLSFKNGNFLNPNALPKLRKHKDKKRFEKFIENDRNALLVLPRYDHSLGRSIVDIIDLNNFEIIHTYRHDVVETNKKIKNLNEFPRINIDQTTRRFRYDHPLVLDDGSMISFGKFYPIFKIDLCSNLQWINDEEMFHHGLNLDHNGDIWAIASMDPKSKYVKKYSIQNYSDDAIIKINTDGKILYSKSITEILIENNIVQDNFVLNNYVVNNFDPIHLNDIQPAFQNTKYWNKGDLFISIREQNAIIHFRPMTNKVINYITGPFAAQHDPDIISDNEISIFNNNNFIVNNEYSEILIYNFENKEFKRLFNDELKQNNFKTETNGLHEILNDGSLMVEETIHGRLILFNNQGEKEWEFVNKDKNGDIGRLFWSRIIEDELFIEKFKSLVQNKKC